nr:MAG TPA: hypothetical protein [Caudoviricetes sp.]
MILSQILLFKLIHYTSYTPDTPVMGVSGCYAT